MNPRDDRASSRVPREQNTFAPKSYVPKEAPLSLGQMQHIAPKPFRRSKETIDLGEVRKILSSERTPGVAPSAVEYDSSLLRASSAENFPRGILDG